MTPKTNIRDWYGMSNMGIIRELARFIKECRLKKNYTQLALATRAGINRITLSEFEQGRSGSSLSTFVQLLRALEELEVLEAFVITTTISPLQMARMEAKKRKRASPARKAKPVKKAPARKKKPAKTLKRKK